MRHAGCRVSDPAGTDARCRDPVFNDNETWLARVLDEGREAGTLRVTGSSNEMARIVIATLEGAMLVALPFGDVARFQTAATSLMTSLSPSPAGSLQSS